MPLLRLLLAAALAAVTADVAVAASGNLNVNPHFNRDLAGWTVFDPGNSTTASYNALDATGAPDSGSALVSAIYPSPFVIAALQSSCFPVTAGTYYRWHAAVFIPGGQASTGGVQPALRFSTSPSCTSFLAPFYYISNTSTIGSLVQLHGEGPAPAGAVAAELWLEPFKSSSGGTFSAIFDDAGVVQLGCAGQDSDTTLCLQNGRFAATAHWQTASASGQAGAVQLTSDTGYFWFFNSANVEVVLKVLNACVGFQRYWVFSSGLTNVQVDVTVQDTQSALTQVYHNPLNTSYPPKLDTNAFATCP
jgi:hypothetical protein